MTEIWKKPPRYTDETYSVLFLLRWAVIGLLHENQSALAAEMSGHYTALYSRYNQFVREEIMKRPGGAAHIRRIDRLDAAALRRAAT